MQYPLRSLQDIQRYLYADPLRARLRILCHASTAATKSRKHGLVETSSHSHRHTHTNTLTHSLTHRWEAPMLFLHFPFSPSRHKLCRIKIYTKQRHIPAALLSMSNCACMWEHPSLLVGLSKLPHAYYCPHCSTLSCPKSSCSIFPCQFFCALCHLCSNWVSSLFVFHARILQAPL